MPQQPYPQQPYQQQPYQQQPPGSSYAAPRSPSNGTGTAGFVLGIISLVTWLVPIVGVPVTATGMVLSFVGRSKVNRGEATNGGQCVAGIVMTAVSIPLIIVSAVLGAIMML